MTLYWRVRYLLGRIKRSICLWKKIEQICNELDLLERNFYYETGQKFRDNAPNVLGIADTLQKIIHERKSIWRYGDGEFRMMLGKRMGSQCVDLELGKRLREIIGDSVNDGLCAIPNIFGSMDHFNLQARRFWRDTLFRTGEKCLPLFCSHAIYGDACISRPSQECPACGVTDGTVFDLWKELVKGHDLLIVEGRFSRLGVGNDLFDGAKSTMRLWCPPFNAYTFYDEILETTKKYAQGRLILLALGATATVLAYDLCKAGFWAIDAGHVDVEYMWKQMGAKEKVPVPGRYVGEVGAGHELIPIAGEEKRLNVIQVIGK